MGQKAEVMDGCLKKVKKEQVRHLNLGSMQRWGWRGGQDRTTRINVPSLLGSRDGPFPH